MSGLAAVYHRDGRPIDVAALWAMLDAAPYRGPDGMQVRPLGAVALGHAHMVVTPEDARERQPLVSPRTGCAIVADVRLDNREELLRRLPDWVVPSTGDAELILRGYDAWGLEVLPRLLGDFAFVIWDPREQRLVCARDTSGQRGLFYRATPGTFAAASEIQQLLQDPAVPVLPNDERIQDYLVPFNVYRNEQDREATFYQGISALPAGHVLVVRPDSLHTRRYWELQPPAELRYRTDDEYAEHYLALFSEVVRTRLRSAYPIGALVSGGLDSSSIVCTAEELYRSGRAATGNLVGLSFVYRGMDCDEQDLLEDIRVKYGLPMHYAEAADMGDWLQPEPRGFMESPNMGWADVRDSVFAAAHERGVRILLTGEMADSCVGGTARVFDSLIHQGQVRELWRHLQAYRRTSGETWRKILALHCLAPLLPLGAQRWLNTLEIKRAFERDRADLTPFWMARPLRDTVTERHLALALEAEHRRHFSSPTREEEYRALYPPEVSRHPVPWSLVFCRPFADRRLHEFLLAIPPEQKFAPHPDTDEFYAGSKRLVRRAMRGILPESIRTRTAKTYFDSILPRSVERQWSLFETTFGPDARPEVVRRGYVDHSLFWSRLTWLRQGADLNDFNFLRSVISLEAWLRGFALPRPRLVTVPPPLRVPSQPSEDEREAAVLVARS